MNKRFLSGWLLVFAGWMVGSMVVHGLLLGADYTALQGTLFRTPEDSQRHFPLLLTAHLVMAGAFVRIYLRGLTARPWLGQGIRFGVAVALLTAVPTYTIYFVVQPTPAMLAVKQAVFDGLLTVVLGVLAAWWFRQGRR